MRSPRKSSSQVTPNNSAIAGSMDMSGQDAPVSQPETVLLETPSESATSCWVIPLDFRNTLKNSPMFDLIPIASRVFIRSFYHFRSGKARQKAGTFVRESRNRDDFPGISPFRRRRAQKKPSPAVGAGKGRNRTGGGHRAIPSRRARRLLSAAHSASTEEVVLSSCTPTPQQPISPSATPR